MITLNQESEFVIPNSVRYDSEDLRASCDAVKDLGFYVNKFNHFQTYHDVTRAMETHNRSSLNLKKGKVLNVGLQSIQFLCLRSSLTGEFIDPLDNLVVHLRRDGVDAYGISPEVKECPDWNEIGLYHGVSQNIPFDDSSFSTLLCFGFLDESYNKLLNIVTSTPDFYKRTAEEFRRVIEPNGECMITGGPVPNDAISELRKVGFEITNLICLENWVIHLTLKE